MAKEFNIYTYPTFFSLLLIMLIPFALSVDDIMNNHQSNMKIILLISAFIIIILVYGLVKTRKRKIVINELGLLITEKDGKSSLWSVNFYRFRIAILAFSHKKDIIVVKSNQWYLKLI